MRRMCTIGGVVLAALAAVVRSGGIAEADERPIFCGTKNWHSLIAEAAARIGVPESWIHAVMHAESGGCDLLDGKPTTSAAGAMGLMQLMPATWSQMREQLRLGSDPYNPRDNIFAGAAMLRELYERYGSPGFLAAYHAGGKRFEEYLERGRPLPDETLDYVAQVQRLLAARQGRFAGTQAALTAIRTPFVQSIHASSVSTSSLDQSRDTRPFVLLTHTVQHAKQQAGEPADVQQP